MPDVPAANAAQIDYWNATAGPTWAALQEQIDRHIESLGREALAALAPAAGERIIDVGCGCGQTTLDLARRVGPSGAVTGLDISAPMLEVARGRPVPAGGATPQFRQLDVQTADLDAGAYDAAFSRFGVMFFADPVAAFANLRQALARDGRLAFVCWRAFQDNPWMRLPAEAAQPFLPPAAPMDPTAPGPFAFADADRLRAILADAGFTAIDIRPLDTRIGGSSIDATVELAFRVGPLGAALRENPDRAPAVRDAVRAVVSRYDTPEGVLMPAAVWIAQARAR